MVFNLNGVYNTNKADDVRSLYKKNHTCFLYNPLDKINISNGRIYNTREWPMYNRNHPPNQFI